MRNNRVLRLTLLTLDGLMDAFYRLPRSTTMDKYRIELDKTSDPMKLTTELAPTVAMHSRKTPLQLGYRGLTKSCL
jgi:hypothetical protein